MLRQTKRIYLDYASTTPLDPKVFREMKPWLTERFGNPSALYDEGLVAKRAVFEARSEIAKIIHARPEEIIFTGSGTEADNLAIFGVFQPALDELAKSSRAHSTKPHIITTNIEHPAVLEACKRVEQLGGEVSYIPVEENGIVDPKKIREALKSTTVLVSVMYANNEIGTIQPIAEIAKVIRAWKNGRRDDNQAVSNAPYGAHAPYYHTDASQAANYCDLNREKLGVDMMTLDASKIYGPKGVGLLVVKSIVPLKSIVFGGGQEKGLRAGTENTAAIVGMAAALRYAQAMREKESTRLIEIRDYCFDRLLSDFPRANITINGDRHIRLPNNVNICILRKDSEFLVIQLNEAGIAAASVSSCKNLSESISSYVIEALGQSGQEKNCSSSSLRFTFGRKTTKKDVDALLKTLKNLL